MKRLECEKRLTPWENAKAMAISKKVDILEDTARLLCIRGIDTEKKAEHYLYAGKEYFIDPFMLKGVKECVERITLAKERKEKLNAFKSEEKDIRKLAKYGKQFRISQEIALYIDVLYY